METTADFLDALRAKLELPSDGQLAAHLGVHRQYLSRYRNNVITFDDEMSIKVAHILKIEPAYVASCMHYQRAKQPAVKAMWKHTAKMLGGIAAAVLIVVALPYLAPIAGVPHLEPISFDNNAFYASGLYIMRI